MSKFEDRLQSPQILRLDGATGTELTRRGFALASPAWSAAAIVDASELLLEIHRDYVAAGAEIVTANTFRTHARNLRSAGWEFQAADLTHHAVQLARQAAGSDRFVAGSIAPLEDCYSPELTPELRSLEREHLLHAENLAAAGVDLILIETQVTIREAVAATRAALCTKLPVLTSFTLKHTPSSQVSPQLLSGESLQDAMDAVTQLGVRGVLLNCIPASEVLPAFASLRIPPEVVTGAYANTGRMLADGSWTQTDAQNPAVYAEYANAWKAVGIRLIGGCCGTTPQHISLLP